MRSTFGHHGPPTKREKEYGAWFLGTVLVRPTRWHRFEHAQTSGSRHILDPLDRPAMASERKDAPAPLVTLISGDGKKFAVDKAWLCLSQTCSAILDAKPDTTELSFSHIDGVTLALVVEYLEHWKGVAPRRDTQSDAFLRVFAGDEATVDFIVRAGLDGRQLRCLIAAAAYLDIQSLYDLAVVEQFSRLVAEVTHGDVKVTFTSSYTL